MWSNYGRYGITILTVLWCCSYVLATMNTAMFPGYEHALIHEAYATFHIITDLSATLGFVPRYCTYNNVCNKLSSFSSDNVMVCVWILKFYISRRVVSRAVIIIIVIIIKCICILFSMTQYKLICLLRCFKLVF